MESIEVTGKTVDDAISTASAKLGIPADRLDYTVISEGSKGILGIGAGDAKITVSTMPVLAPGETLPAAPVPPQPHGQEEDADVEPEAARPRRPRAQVPDGAALAQRTLEELLERLDVEADVSLAGDDPIALEVSGEDLGILIGHRGETLTALQFMLNQMLNHKVGDWMGVVVDVEQYRARREHTLEGLAKRMADRARYYRQPVTLEPMPAHERRIVHLALQEHPQVTTHSIGEGEDRRVVISPRE
ncbi:MAG: RNA-binding cell elongation regulator Jag/EloR [Chloroflexota bacterium]